jgi:hypothetical protein
MTAIYDPGPPAGMEIHDDGAGIPQPGDLITNEGAYVTSTHRVREVVDHGAGRYTLLLSCACKQCEDRRS